MNITVYVSNELFGIENLCNNTNVVTLFITLLLADNLRLNNNTMKEQPGFITCFLNFCRLADSVGKTVHSVCDAYIRSNLLSNRQVNANEHTERHLYAI